VVREGKRQPVPLENSIEDVRLINAVRRSMRSNVWVTV
jgi:hypothetical protein